MWRLLLILSFALQPFAAGRMDCAGLCGGPAEVVSHSCCASGGCSFTAASEQRTKSCCGAVTICNCGEQREQPAPAPSRTNTLDQILIAIEFASDWLREPEPKHVQPVRSARDAMLPSAIAPQAFFCVWLT